MRIPKPTPGPFFNSSLSVSFTTAQRHIRLQLAPVKRKVLAASVEHSAGGASRLSAPHPVAIRENVKPRRHCQELELPRASMVPPRWRMARCTPRSSTVEPRTLRVSAHTLTELGDPTTCLLPGPDLDGIDVAPATSLAHVSPQTNSTEAPGGGHSAALFDSSRRLSSTRTEPLDPFQNCHTKDVTVKVAIDLVSTTTQRSLCPSFREHDHLISLRSLPRRRNMMIIDPPTCNKEVCQHPERRHHSASALKCDHATSFFVTSRCRVSFVLWSSLSVLKENTVICKDAPP